MRAEREIVMPNLNEKVTRTRNYQERSVPKFLKKIFFILEENKHSDYIAWSGDGNAMIVKKPKEFAEKILPLYFKHNNLASFIRQVNMYNFKKKKNYNYDHAYSHDMFQKGRIDLLRNIHRKSTENTPALPSIVADLKTCKEDVEIDIDELLQENMQYKSLHKALFTQVQVIDNKMRDLKSEIQMLHSEQNQLKANEQFLKKVIKNLARRFGVENIKNVIEAQGFEFPLDFQGANEARSNMNSSARITNVNQNYNSATYYSSDSYSDEMDGVYTQQPSMQGASNEYGLSSSNSEYEHQHDQSSPYLATEMKEEHVQAENGRQCENDSYANWFEKIEKQHFNADAFLGSEENNENNHLDVADLFMGENSLVSRARF